MISVASQLWLKKCLSIQTGAKAPFATEVKCICGLHFGLHGHAACMSSLASICLVNAPQHAHTDM